MRCPTYRDNADATVYLLKNLSGGRSTWVIETWLCKGKILMDGGVSSPIPIEKSIEDGNSFHIIILTRNEGYEEAPLKHMGITRLLYRKYPRLVETMRRHHEIYNRQLCLCEQMAASGGALIIRPQNPLTMESTERDIAALLRLHDEGYEEGVRAVNRIKEKC